MCKEEKSITQLHQQVQRVKITDILGGTQNEKDYLIKSWELHPQTSLVYLFPHSDP